MAKILLFSVNCTKVDPLFKGKLQLRVGPFEWMELMEELFHQIPTDSSPTYYTKQQRFVQSAYTQKQSTSKRICLTIQEESRNKFSERFCTWQ